MVRNGTLRLVIRSLPTSRAARLRRTLSVLLSAVLLLQSVIAGACAAHDAAHGGGGAADAVGHAAAADSHDTASVPMAPDSGESESLHAILYAAHCGGCVHGAGASAQGLHLSACITVSVPATFAGCTPISFLPDPSLRPPISA